MKQSLLNPSQSPLHLETHEASLNLKLSEVTKISAHVRPSKILDLENLIF